ncbi:Uncharacterised protein [Mycobacteroides abscessus subsp. abscessus]|nr:Uncharacterised protein [Mycobacteroides abscessus subsp. abscessus]
MKISRIDNNETIKVNGNSPYVVNSALVTSALTASAMLVPWNRSKCRAVPPNTAVHKRAMSGGMISTPTTNSLMVLPLDTRAMNAPTNGDQAIAHAQ